MLQNVELQVNVSMLYHYLVAQRTHVDIYLSMKWELLLNHSGIKDGQPESMTVCPHHHDVLGLRFRPSRLCVGPIHVKSKSKKPRGNRAVNKEVAYSMKEKFELMHIPIGSGKLTNSSGFFCETLHSGTTSLH